MIMSVEVQLWWLIIAHKAKPRAASFFINICKFNVQTVLGTITQCQHITGKFDEINSYICESGRYSHQEILMKKQIITITRSILLLAILAFCQSAYTQSKIIEVTDGRPVAKAAQFLESIYGVSITYDDPITVHESQLQDVTEQVQRTPDPSHRVIVQKDLTISFSYKPPISGTTTKGGLGQTQAVTEAEVAEALSSVLDGYGAAGGPVTFTITKEGGIFYIIPNNFLNKEGKMQQMMPILDTKITILPKKRTRFELLQEICQALILASGVPVGGEFPFNGGSIQAQTLTSISGSDVTARSLLGQLLVELEAPISSDTVIQIPGGEKRQWNRVVYEGGPVSWKLFYGPGFGYALNMHKVTLANQ
jgi:hypothetical protein